MIFSDLIFVFAFLPLYLICSFCCRETWAKNAVSVIFSLVFAVWGRRWYYALIILPVFLIYICGLLSKRVNNRVSEVIADAFAIGFSMFATVTLCADGTLRSGLLAVGYILFALRSCLYMKHLAEGMEPERDFLALSVYLFSFENMLPCQLRDYQSARRELSERRVTLSKMSSGLSMFIRGFAKMSVCAFGFDAVRLAAVEYEAFPWLNALIIIPVSLAEAYIALSASVEMSSAIGLMNGLSPELRNSCFVPRLKLSDHISELWSSLAGLVRGLSGKGLNAGSAVCLALISLSAGVFIGFGAFYAACFCLILLAIVFEGFSEKPAKPSDLLITVPFAVLSALVLFCGTVPLPRLFSALDPSAYGYDVTFVLNKELLRSLPRLALGLLWISPLSRMVSALVREKMRESDGFYSASRIFGAALDVFLLMIAAVAAAVQ